AGVHGLVTLGIDERLRDVRRKRRVTGGLAVQTEAPASLAQMLEQLHRPVPGAVTKPTRRPGKALPETVLVQPLEQQHLPARTLDRDARRDDAGVVHDSQRAPDHVRQLCKGSMIHPLGQAFVDQQARLVAARHWMLRDESRREVVLELPRFHPTGTLPLTRMEDGAIERAKERVEQRAEGAALDA